MNLMLFLSEGANLHETAELAGDLQQAINLAYHAALKDAGVDVAGPQSQPQPPPDNFSDGNPFA